MNHLLVYPIAFYVLHINCILLFVFLSRVKAVKDKKINPKFFKAYNMETPEYLLVRGRHFDNQFQVPILFMITCLTFMTLDLVNMTVIWLAWVYVATRLIHSWVHLGKNYIPYRFSIFGASWFVLCFMWILLMFKVVM